jgi:serine protease
MLKAAVVLWAGAMTGCALDQPLELGTTEGMSFEEFRERVAIETTTGYFIVDWDRVITTEQELFEVWGTLQQGALAVGTNGGADVKWNETQKRNITYCVGASFGANKAAVVAAMEAATTNGWEKFADVNFVHLTNEDANCTAQNANVVFDVNQVTGQPYLARAFFPNSGRAQRNVLIDTSSFNPAQTGNIPLANIVAHELGHTLGFRHEHTRPEANAGECFEDNQFRGLTTYDSGSVMHYPQCNGTSTTLAFTARDQEGVRLLYGAPVANAEPMTQLTFPTDGQTVPPTFEVQASVVDTDLVRAELYIDDVLYQTLTSSPFTFQVTNLSAGPHELKIAGTDAINQTAETTVISITVQNGTGPGGNDPDGGDGDDSAGDITGGCSTGGGTTGILFALGLVGLVWRRRR